MRKLEYIYCCVGAILISFDSISFVFAQQTFVLMKTYWRRFQDVLKTSSRHNCNTSSWRHLEDVLKTRNLCWVLRKAYFYILIYIILYYIALQWRLENVLKTFWKHLENVLKRSWRRLWKRSWRCLEDVLEDVLKTSWKTRNLCWVFRKAYFYIF